MTRETPVPPDADADPPAARGPAWDCPARTSWALTSIMAAATLLALPPQALAQDRAPGEGAPTAERPPVLTQKLRLLQQLLASPRAQAAAARDAQAAAGLQRARELLAEAAQGGDAAEAETRVNEALRLTTHATRALAPAPVPLAAARQAEMREQITEYRRAIVVAAKARGQAEPAEALARLDAQVVDAERHTAASQPQEAAQALEAAYRIAVDTLSTLRAGETVSIELKFHTPADEYAYELKRYHGHVELLNNTLAERRPGGVARDQAEQRAGEARALQASAAEHAARGEHATGVKQLEEAVRLLFRALQAAGMPGLQ